MEHNTVTRHDAMWTFFTDGRGLTLRGCTVCGDVEMIVITQEQRIASRRGGR